MLLFWTVNTETMEKCSNFSHLRMSYKVFNFVNCDSSGIMLDEPQTMNNNNTQVILFLV